MSIVGCTETRQNEQSAEIFMKMWNKIVRVASCCEDESLLMLEKIAISLLQATRPAKDQVKYKTLVR